MLLIFIKSSVCLLGFLVFYKLLLEKENMHVFKRVYLLSAIIIAIIIPFITFTNYIEAIPQAVVESSFIQENLNSTSIDILQETNYISYMLWSLYGIITVLLTYRFSTNIFSIWKNIKNNSHQRTENTVLVLVEKPMLPQTFFKYIFLNKSEYVNKQIPETVLQHETTHAKQKHSLDVLIVELLLVIFWFNPLLYVLRNTIKLNHEFLADQAVLKKGCLTQQYQKTLLAFSSNAQHNQLANAINYSSIKKRLTIMKTKTTTKTKWIKTVLIIPLVALLLFSFSNTKEVLLSSTETRNLQQKKATAEQIEEYNALAKKYNTQDKNERVIQLKDIKRLKYLYGLMTRKQKTSAESLPVFPPLPPSPIIVKGEKTNIPPPHAPMISSFNGVKSDGDVLELTRGEIINGTVSIEGKKVKTFLIKFRGKPTVSVNGNQLNSLAKKYLKQEKGGLIQIFAINQKDKINVKPILLKIKK